MITFCLICGFTVLSITIHIYMQPTTQVVVPPFNPRRGGEQRPYQEYGNNHRSPDYRIAGIWTQNLLRQIVDCREDRPVHDCGRNQPLQCSEREITQENGLISRNSPTIWIFPLVPSASNAYDSRRSQTVDLPRAVPVLRQYLPAVLAQRRAAVPDAPRRC